jgi:hypothetical protein
MRYGTLSAVLTALYDDIVSGRLVLTRRPSSPSLEGYWHGMIVVIGEVNDVVSITIMTSRGGTGLAVRSSTLPSRLADELLRLWVEVNPNTAALDWVASLLKE